MRDLSRILSMYACIVCIGKILWLVHLLNVSVTSSNTPPYYHIFDIQPWPWAFAGFLLLSLEFPVLLWVFLQGHTFSSLDFRFLLYTHIDIGVYHFLGVKEYHILGRIPHYHLNPLLSMYVFYGFLRFSSACL